MITLVGLAVPVTAFLLLLGTGLNLTTDDFARVRRQRALVLTGLFAPVVLLPPLALLLIWFFQPPAEIVAGTLIVAASPIGGISNAYSYLARASMALSVTLTGISCLCASVTIPMVGKALELALAGPLGLEAPLALLAGEIVLVLGLPVVLGMWARRRVPGAIRYSALLQRIAFIGILVVLVLVIAGDFNAFVREWPTTFPLVTAFVVGSFVIGWATAALVTSDPRDRFTVAAEFGTRNVGVATAIAVTFLGRVDFARFAATYAFTEVPLMLAAVGLFRAHQARKNASRKVRTPS